MNQSKLFIHIGTWKTGSSTIQFNLFKVRSELEKEGFFYLCKDDKMVERGEPIREFTELREGYVKRSREKFKRILNEQKSKNKDIHFISSGEEYSGNPFLGFKNVGAVAENLYHIAKGLGLDIRIIVYLRRQDDFFESLYQQTIRLGDSHSFREFLEKFDSSHFNWQNMIQVYADLFGKENIIVRRYHKKYLPEENSLVQDFGKVIGSEVVANYQSTTSKNKGFSRDTLEIMKIMNAYFEGDERFKLRKIFDQVNSKLPFENYSFFTANERAVFLKKYEKSNAAVAKEYLGEDSLFPEPDYQSKSKQYTGLNTEALVVSFSKALLLVKQEAETEKRKLAQNFRSNFLRFRIRRFISQKLDSFPGLKYRLRNFLRDE